LIGVAFAGAFGATGLAADLGAGLVAFFTEEIFTGDLGAFAGLVDVAEVLIVLTLTWPLRAFRALGAVLTAAFLRSLAAGLEGFLAEDFLAMSGFQRVLWRGSGLAIKAIGRG
jgi:hypothetical protein